MSLKLIKESNTLKILEGEIPEGKEVIVFTEDEVLQFEGWRQWMALSEEQRDDMMLQTQSSGYQQWMDEDDWAECRVEEVPSQHPSLKNFKA